mgnify:CR=1 FL=1
MIQFSTLTNPRLSKWLPNPFRDFQFWGSWGVLNPQRRAVDSILLPPIPMPLLTEPYLTQLPPWPPMGRHILAQYDAETVVVYQAYAPAKANSPRSKATLVVSSS